MAPYQGYYYWEFFYWREMLVNINEWKCSDSNADEFFCGTALRSVWSILITCRQINTYIWFASMKNWIYGILCCTVILMTYFIRNNILACTRKWWWINFAKIRLWSCIVVWIGLCLCASQRKRLDTVNININVFDSFPYFFLH